MNIIFPSTAFMAPNQPYRAQDSSPTSNSSFKRTCVDLKNLLTNHGLRENISFYHLNNQDEIRNIIEGHYQPLQSEFE